jgi:hypothetical protein
MTPLLKNKCRAMHLVINGNEGVMGREGTGRALPVHQQRPLPSAHHMLLHLGDIVRNIINHVQVQVVRGRVEDLGKGLGRTAC